MVLEYVKVPSAKLVAEVSIDETALTTFFEAHQEEYRIPEAVRMRFLAYDPAAFAQVKEITDEQIQEYYELNRDSEFTTEETIGARHILKRAGADDEAKAKAKQAIEAIAARLAAGGNFEQIAREESEDPGSGAKGGDLGSFGRGRMVKPFEDAAFGLQPGQTSGVVETEFGYHIIQVYERKPAGTTALENARDQIAKKLAEERSATEAFDAAAADALTVREGGQLDSVAATRGLTVKATPPLSRGAIVPDVGAAPQLIEAALVLQDKKDVTDPIAVAGKHYIVQLEERVDSFVPPLADVREKVEEAYRKDQAAEQARTKATTAIEEIRGGKTIAALSETSGFETGTTEEFTRRGAFVPGLGNVPGLKELAFQASAGAVLPRAFLFEGNAYAFVVKDRKPVQRDEFEPVKDSRLAALRRSREQAAVADFVAQLRQQTDVVYNQALLAQLMPQEPASASP
jgi:peptidyl-prolyl cis-trans isomerase D